MSRHHDTHAHVGLTMKPGLHATLKETAAENGRTLAAEIRWTLQHHYGVDANGKPRGGGGTKSNGRHGRATAAATTDAGGRHAEP